MLHGEFPETSIGLRGSIGQVIFDAGGLVSIQTATSQNSNARHAVSGNQRLLPILRIGVFGCG